MINVSKLSPEALEVMKDAGFDPNEKFWDITSEQAFAECYSAMSTNVRGEELPHLIDGLRAADESKIGERGKDQGVMKMGVTHDEGHVIIDFGGTQVTWIGVPPEQAVTLATHILKHAKLALS